MKKTAACRRANPKANEPLRMGFGRVGCALGPSAIATWNPAVGVFLFRTVFCGQGLAGSTETCQGYYGIALKQPLLEWRRKRSKRGKAFGCSGSIRQATEGSRVSFGSGWLGFAHHRQGSGQVRSKATTRSKATPYNTFVLRPSPNNIEAGA